MQGCTCMPAGAIPSFAAASELLSAPYSCLVLNNHRRHIALPPVYLNKKRTGIKEELDAELLKFSHSMANLEHAEDDQSHVKMPGELPAAGLPVKPGQESCAPGGTAGAIPSFAAASELLSAPYSCLVLNNHRRHIALPPVYLNKKRTGIKEELDAELLKFSHRYPGLCGPAVFGFYFW
ncbi:hypothetical protein XENOCAPTIV_008488 [Xenoophorus captivus]|uniref:Uncharacterized protein n=1 Tax=Xenoophorus captivus TaxID=1517983 RepID=A0ABV0RKD0_9TELE